MIKVSIIVPVYNVENYIEKCLNSLVNQTLDGIEILIINDGSKDGSKKIIQKYLEKYKTKIKYHEKENGGLSDARNYGLKYAVGKYIAFLDSDDYVENDTYEKMYDLAEKENSDLVECDFLWEYPKKIKKDIGSIYSGKKEMLLKSRVVAWNKLYKADLLKKADIQFEKGLRYEDVEFFYRLIPNIEKVSFLKEEKIHYIQRETSLVNTQNEGVKDIFKAFENVFEYYMKHGIYDEYKEELEYTYLRILMCSSLKRISKVADKEKRNALVQKTWEELNTRFPNWKKNKYLCNEKGLKNIYLKSLNKNSLKIYSKILEI